MPDTKREFYNVCPDCWSVRVKLRIFKAPRYKCEVCGAVFPNKKRISYDDRLLFNNLMKRTAKKLQQRYHSPWEQAYLRKITVIAIKELMNHD